MKLACLPPYFQTSYFLFKTKNSVVGRLGNMFTGSREICELWENVNHKSKFTEKSREPGSHKLGSRTIFLNN